MSCFFFRRGLSIVSETFLYAGNSNLFFFFAFFKTKKSKHQQILLNIEEHQFIENCWDEWKDFLIFPWKSNKRRHEVSLVMVACTENQFLLELHGIWQCACTWGLIWFRSDLIYSDLNSSRLLLNESWPAEHSLKVPIFTLKIVFFSFYSSAGLL